MLIVTKIALSKPVAICHMLRQEIYLDCVKPQFKEVLQLTLL